MTADPKWVLFGMTIGSVLLSPGARAQTHNAFDVASIKRSETGTGIDAPIRADTLPGGRFLARNLPLRALITVAFGIKDQALIGAPGWLNERYDIDAIVNGAGELTTIELQQALKSLLQERMKLEVHTDTRQMSSYGLSVAPGGLKLKVAAANASDSSSSQYVPPSPTSPPHFVVRNASMQNIAFMLSRHPDIQRDVVDETGIPGRFDFTIEWESVSAKNDSAVASAQPVASIFTVLEEQLGLKLTPHKGPVPVLVIDHVERPSPN